MTPAPAVLAWALIALAVNLLAVIEILGLFEVWKFHTVSYIAHHNPAVAALIFAFFIVLPVWWLWHVQQAIVS